MQRSIKCAFCQGTGHHPYFSKDICPVCKGAGNNRITWKSMPCNDCHGSGQKSGTTLTCHTCGGLGVVPDTREIMEKARQEISKGRQALEKERRQT